MPRAAIDDGLVDAMSEHIFTRVRADYNGASAANNDHRCLRATRR